MPSSACILTGRPTARRARRRYLSIMKLIFISSTLAIVHQMRSNRTIKATYDRERDTFRYEFLIGGSLLLATVLHEPIRRPGVIHFVAQVPRPLLRPRELARFSNPCAARAPLKSN